MIQFDTFYLTTPLETIIYVINQSFYQSLFNISGVVKRQEGSFDGSLASSDETHPEGSSLQRSQGPQREETGLERLENPESQGRARGSE